MTRQRELMLNTFQMSTPTHTWAGLWRHPGDRSVDYNKLEYWTTMAQTAERGLLDGIFVADVFGVYDVYGGGPETAIRAGAQAPSADPTIAVSAMAHVTRHIGFGITANLTYEHPFQFARRFSTLDHFTEGRIGWNIVTGYLNSGAKGMGLDVVREHDERYEAAEDFMAAVYKLWEGSWEENAAVRDRETGIFTHPERVHPVHHDGPYYKVHARHLSEPSRQRTPVLYQAGTSARGTAFAAKHAECVFLNGPTREIASRSVKALREQARSFGRDPYDVAVFLAATVVVAPTTAEAHDLVAEYRRYLDIAGQLALVAGWTGIDFSKMSLDDTVKFFKSNAIRSTVENMTVSAPKPVQVRDLVEFSNVGARAPFIVGSPADVAEELIGWADATDVDGFNLVRVVSPGSLESFVDLVVPELQSRGAFKREYREGSLREKMFGQSARLNARHPGAAARRFDRL
ncbi:LLM class flavin-dependent oxidoreductase [Bradyrhizobium sp.]|uniref:LLM class flavin-dependent oxidoreductase n=1 Tax=Bradyrhizobium sp. TaxID=376 RepID=UPI0039E3B3E3